MKYEYDGDKLVKTIDSNGYWMIREYKDDKLVNTEDSNGHREATEYSEDGEVLKIVITQKKGKQ